jgi:hypothetical protein
LPLAWTVTWLAGVMAVAWYVGRSLARPVLGKPKSRYKPPPSAAVLVVALFLLPLVIEPLRVLLFGPGYPLEILLLTCLRNLGLGLAALSAWPLCLHLAALVSLFLVLVASSMTHGPLVLAQLGTYAATATLWLMRAYWNGLRWRPMAGQKAGLPLAGPVLILAIAGSVFAASTWGPTRRLLGTLWELLPSSGGTGDYHANARGGINDGDDEVRGTENARSVGFTDSDFFLDSPLPSLYDAFNDLYGEPYKPKE